jgi:tRNA-modifying protein YgfZ
VHIEKRFVIFLTNIDQSLKFINSLSPSKVKTTDDSESIYSIMLKNNGRFDFDFFITRLENNLILDANIKFSEAIESFFKKYKLKNAKFDTHQSTNKEFFQKFYTINKDINEAGRIISLEEISKQIIKTSNQNNDNPILVIQEDNRFLIQNKIVLRVFIDSKIALIFDEEVKKYFTEIKAIENVDDFFIENKIIDGSWLIREKSIILEYGFDKLCNESVIDFNKGCYLGQELITRIKRSGVIRKKVKKIPNEDSAKNSNAEIIKVGSKSTLILDSIE